MIRIIEERDAESFLKLCKKIDEESEFMLFEIGERNITIEEQRSLIKKLSKSFNSTIFVAEINAELVGYLIAIGGKYKRTRHSVNIIIGVTRKYSGNGIGTMLLKELEIWARSVGILRLELTVKTNNKSAIVLYGKLGYEIEGIKRGSCIINESLIDSYYMSKILIV
ncbi:GNAT family N-acetyltransferase [Bacillus pseudomycoides]|uniref:GNAT family N-acetyltransferase n=1 Tax=Bacillus pseudomycoides TaxID=64104 RepID=UPI000BF6E971|nr:GNAT family N-acetyltransferase [Bacillus pseudomycoides]PEP63514.1 GNAT family N-acetyltransferase [Bacillus pseudomycoides]